MYAIIGSNIQLLEDTTTKMFNMQVQGKRRSGRPEKRWLHTIGDDMNEYKMTKDMANNRIAWHVDTKAGPLLLGGIGEKERNLGLHSLCP